MLDNPERDKVQNRPEFRSILTREACFFRGLGGSAEVNAQATSH
jgi:hypothetical protein